MKTDDPQESTAIHASSNKPKPPKTRPVPPPALRTNDAIMARNDLGMHRMNPTFGEFCLLPTFDTVRATVTRRGYEPDIFSPSSSSKVNDFIPGNSVLTTKTDFWDHALKLFGINLPANISLTDNKTTGFKVPSRAERQSEATGIAVTHRMEPVNGNPPEINPFPFATFE